MHACESEPQMLHPPFRAGERELQWISWMLSHPHLLTCTASTQSVDGLHEFVVNGLFGVSQPRMCIIPCLLDRLN